MAGIGHTGCQRGKRVLIILQSGERFVDVFVEQNDRVVVMKKYGKVMKRDMRAFIPYRGEVARLNRVK